MENPRYEAVVIGVSAGAVEALSTVLPNLPGNFSLPILVVVHVPADKSLMVELFQSRCALAVKEAEDKEWIKPGTVYFAPPNYHLMVEQGKFISLSNDEPVLYSRPSVDILFETAADAYGEALIGVIMTGASHDGAQGLRAVAESGGLAVVQDPATAQSPFMPKAALEACPDAIILTLEQIPIYLQKAAMP